MMLQPLQTGGSATSTVGIILILGVAGYLILERWDIQIEEHLPSLDSDSGVLGFLTTRNSLILGGLLLLLALVLTGTLGLPRSAGVPLVVGIELAALAAILVALDAFTLRLYAATAIAVVVLGLSAMGEPVIGAIANSAAGPILAVGGLYLGYKYVTGDRSARKIVVEGSISGDDDS